MFDARLWATCAARCGRELSPTGLAEGAASGRPTRAISPSAATCFGERSAIDGQTRGDEIGDRATCALRGSTSVSGPGQKRCGEARERAERTRRAPPPSRGRDVADERVEGGPALGCVDPGDRDPVGGVGGEAVDGLGGDRDEPAGEDDGRRAVEVGGRHADDRRGSPRGRISESEFIDCRVRREGADAAPAKRIPDAARDSVARCIGGLSREHAFRERAVT